MNYRSVFRLFLPVLILVSAGGALAQEPSSEQDERVAEIEENLKWEDYTVKAYRLTFFGGNFSGATYLDLPLLWDRTRLEEGAHDVLGFDGEYLPESRERLGDSEIYKYDAAIKEIESGPAFGATVGIFISEDFHLDVSGTFATGNAVTTMMERTDETDITIMERVEVDRDDGFKMFKGGLHLMYEAEPAAFFGITPRLGFGLGGVINRYSELKDKTALYLEGNFGLTRKLFGNFNLSGQVDLTSFAYEVEELGYSNMVNYATFSLGLSYFVDVVPSEVRAAHLEELEEANY